MSTARSGRHSMCGRPAVSTVVPARTRRALRNSLPPLRRGISGPSSAKPGRAATHRDEPARKQFMPGVPRVQALQLVGAHQEAQRSIIAEFGAQRPQRLDRVSCLAPFDFLPVDDDAARQVGKRQRAMSARCSGRCHQLRSSATARSESRAAPRAQQFDEAPRQAPRGHCARDRSCRPAGRCSPSRQPVAVRQEVAVYSAASGVPSSGCQS
jgi:hypothetical protein